MNYFKKIYFTILIFSIVIFIFILSFYPSNNIQYTFSLPDFNNTTLKLNNESKYIWPIPGYTKISSYYGKRNSPTAYASSFHKGLDIPAPPGTNIYSSISGTIITAGFSGSGGCTVTIQNNDIFVSYCHVSPNFLVTVGQQVNQGQLIAQVGPKNIYGFSNNKYYDSNGLPTNGATTGPHLHFSIKDSTGYLNPLEYISV